MPINPYDPGIPSTNPYAPYPPDPPITNPYAPNLPPDEIAYYATRGIFFTTRNNVPYSIIDYKLSAQPQGGFEIREVVQVNWDRLDAFFTAILPDVKIGPVLTNVDGSNQMLNLGPYGTTFNESLRYALYRSLPQAHRDYPTAWCVGAELIENKGFPGINPRKGGHLQWNQQNPTSGLPHLWSDGTPKLDDDGKPITLPDPVPGMAHVAVTYRRLPYPVNVADELTNAAGASEILRYCWVQPKPAAESLRIQGRQWTAFSEDGTNPTPSKFAQEFVKPFGRVQLTYTWLMVPVMPAAGRSLLGCVNASEFGLPVFGELQEPGTALYLDCEISDPYFTYSGTPVVDIKYHVLWRSYTDPTRPTIDGPLGHNHLWLPSTNRFYRAYLTDALTGVPSATFPGFLDPGEPGRNVADYADLANLFRLDRVA